MKQTHIIGPEGRHDEDHLTPPIACDLLEPDNLRHPPPLVIIAPPIPCRTSHSPVDRLAPELLQLVFEEASGDNDTQDGHIDEASPIRKSALDTSIKLSHVCGLWRKIVLATPSLWTTIDRFHDEFEIFVRRSKNIHISLNIEAPTDDDPTAPVVITFPVWLESYSGRIREISAEGSTETVQNLLQSVGRSLPQLVALDLRVLDHDFATLQTPMPNLRRLALSRVSANFGGYAELTHLTLDGLYSNLKAAELMNLLRKCPRLFALCLYGVALDVTGGGVGRMDDVVELAQLQTLDFQHLAMDTTLYLLSRIRVPLCAPLVHNDSSSDRELWLEIVADRHIVLGAKAQSPNGVCTFRVDLPYNSRSAFTDINIPMSAVDTSTVVSMLFVAPASPYEPPTTDVWLGFLARLPSLTAITICIPRRWIETFIMALCNHEPPVLCPQLEILTILDADIDDPVAWADLTRLIWQYLHARAQSAVGLLKSLRLPWGCGFDLDWVSVAENYEPNTLAQPSMGVATLSQD